MGFEGGQAAPLYLRAAWILVRNAKMGADARLPYCLLPFSRLDSLWIELFQMSTSASLEVGAIPQIFTVDFACHQRLGEKLGGTREVIS